MEQIPIIDCARLAAADATVRALEVAALRRACQDTGFFYTANHGVPLETITAAMRVSRQFFALDVEEKMRVHNAQSVCNRGYDPLQAQTLEPGAPPDVKEGFFFGVDIPESDPRVRAGVFSLGPNQLPAAPADFAHVLQSYHDAMRALSERLMRGIALSLDLPETWFDAYSAGPMAIVRLLHYPPQPANPSPGEKGCGEHTDFGGITVLLQDAVGGLEVFSQQTQSWIAAPPIDGTFVVNLGDMLGRWTNDRYRSTLHRVINRSGRERYSIPFFLSGDPAMPLECLPTCTSAADPPHYAPTTIAEHFKMKFQQSYGK